jgi:hypothetical protein
MDTETKTIEFHEGKYCGKSWYFLDSELVQVFVGIFPKSPVQYQGNTLTSTGWLAVRKGFRWDGASGPAIDTITNMRASMVHDAIINMIQAGKIEGHLNNKLRTDMAYFRLAREDGMNLFRAVYHLFAIQFNHWERKGA